MCVNQSINVNIRSAIFMERTVYYNIGIIFCFHTTPDMELMIIKLLTYVLKSSYNNGHWNLIRKIQSIRLSVLEVFLASILRAQEWSSSWTMKVAIVSPLQRAFIKASRKKDKCLFTHECRMLNLLFQQNMF